MNKEITLVSAFFNIGRGEIHNTSLSRSNQQYFDYFATWARMQNNLVVYTEPQFVQPIMEIREKFGLGEQTRVIAVEDIYAIEPEIFNRMQEISDREDFCNYRFHTSAMSNRANYDYVMLLKYWCLMDAQKNGYVSDMVAWIDFGFNHGGDLYNKPEEFAYKWEYEFEDKIHLFVLSNPDEELGIRNVQLQTDCIMGCLLLVSANLCESLWNMVKEAMCALMMLDCIDDDQQLLLMAYKAHPELFIIRVSDWFMPLKEYGGSHLSTKEKIAATKKQAGVKDAVKKLLGRTPCQKFGARILAEARKYYEM